MSQITTHILDTTQGKPAVGVAIILYQQQNSKWIELGNGLTNTDGRLTDFYGIKEASPAGIYKLHFKTQAYFDALGVATFYPFVEIVFQVSDGAHYHVPLLLNAFGYSTYRGS